MKLIIATLFSIVFMFSMGWAQKRDSVIKKDNNIFINDRPRIGNPVYVLDGLIVPNIKNVNPSNIFAISVLKGAQDTAKFGKNAADGVILVTTRNYACEKINEKLSTFSKPFKKYILKNHSDKITYILNDSLTTEQTIYNLPKEKIKSVKFIASETNPSLKIKSEKFINVNAEPIKVFIRGDKGLD